VRRFSPLALPEAVLQLASSELYYTRLRRALINGSDRKVLTDFLVLDDVFRVVQRDNSSDLAETYALTRNKAFVRAKKSAERKLDVRIHDQMLRLCNDLWRRVPGKTADEYLNAAYSRFKEG